MTATLDYSKILPICVYDATIGEMDVRIISHLMVKRI